LGGFSLVFLAVVGKRAFAAVKIAQNCYFRTALCMATLLMLIFAGASMITLQVLTQLLGFSKVWAKIRPRKTVRDEAPDTFGIIR
jgi:hypothetical protein